MAFTDVEMAILSQLAYKDVGKGSLYDALTKNRTYLKTKLGSEYEKQISSLIDKVQGKDYAIVQTQANTKSGFSAFAVKEPDNSVTVACRGTEMGAEWDTKSKDLAADVQLTVTKSAAQHKDMEAFMDTLQKGDYKSYSFTGHSLGGNLAMHGAVTLDDPSKLGTCKTYNAPGFNNDYYREHKDTIAAIEKKGKMVSYQNSYDGVSEALKVPGKKAILDSRSKDRDGVTGHNLNDLVIGKDGKFKTAKKKRTTGLGLALYFLSRLPDVIKGTFTPLPPITPIMRTMSGTGMAVNALAKSVAPAKSSGGGKIRITPNELKAQAQQISAVNQQLSTVTTKCNTAFKLLDEALGSSFQFNMNAKALLLLGNLKTLSSSLTTGAVVAQRCATEYENADKILRDELEDELPLPIQVMPESEQEVLSEFDLKVRELKQKEGFRQGDYWGNNSYCDSYKGHYLGAWSCCAKAKQMQIEVTGRTGPYTSITDPKQIQPGDVVHYFYYDKNGTKHQHWVFVTAVNGDTISVGEGNAWDGKNNERVNYRDMKLSDFNMMAGICR